jgi:chromosomal replication initiator protein
MDAKQVWRAALGELQISLSPANYETWLKDTSLVEIDEDQYRIAAPNGFARDWLDNRYRTLVSQTLARVVGGSVQVELVVADASAAPPPAEVSADGEAMPLPPTSPSGNTYNLNARYTFKNFVVGSANRLAHAAACSWANSPLSSPRAWAGCVVTNRSAHEASVSGKSKFSRIGVTSDRFRWI